MKRKQANISKSAGSDFQKLLKLLQKKKPVAVVNNQIINEQHTKNTADYVIESRNTSIATNSVAGKCVLGMTGSILNLDSATFNAQLQEFLGIIHMNATTIRLKSVDCDLKSSLSIVLSPCKSWPDKQIVIAHYEENLDWIPSSWSKMVSIYNKDTSSYNETNNTISNIKNKVDDSSTQDNLNFFTEQLPNVGRESHTYLYHIISNYDQLADVTYFTQGHPFDHAPDFLELVDANVGIVDPFLFLGCQQTTIQNQNVSKYQKSFPGIQAGFNRTISTLFGTYVNLPKITFSPGAIFCVQREKIHERSIEFYKMAIKLLDYDSNPIEGYAFERLWNEIFS
eukprot:gene12950-17365_t